MLERAATRVAGDVPVDAELVEADFVTFLEAHPTDFDAVVAVDAFIYVGDLTPVLTAAAESLRPGGWLVVTLEAATDGTAGSFGFTPDLSGRYLHDAEWVDVTVTAAGFDLVVIDDLSVRREGGVPVPGLVVVAHRSHRTETDE